MKNKFWYEYLKATKLNDGDTLPTCSGNYILSNGILRQRDIYTESQAQTKDTFGFKWHKRDTYESEAMKIATKAWLHERYLNNNEELLRKYVTLGAKVLDAGCGSSVSALIFFKDILKDINYLGIDISNAVDVAKQRFTEAGVTGEFIQSDLNKIPFDRPAFDVIFSEGVLHHTDSTERSFKYLSNFLLTNGYFMFYVYRQKGPVREFTDDYIREKISNLTDEEAWNALRPLTKLGKTLGDLNIEVNIQETIDCLGIPAGKIDLQRLFYWHFFKAYYRPEMNIEEMNHTNFDWYRPQNCHRHTEDEILKWCRDVGLIIEHMNVQESGITVVAKKV